ncbi:MAG: hypothetical protein AB8B82_10590 [Roseovarius sp.]
MRWLIETVNAMGLADKARFVFLLFLGIIIGLSVVVYLPFVIVAWPILLIVFVIQLIGQGAIMAVLNLLSWPFRKTEDTAKANPTAETAPPAKRTPEQRAFVVAFWVGLLIGMVLAVRTDMVVYQTWVS